MVRGLIVLADPALDVAVRDFADGDEISRVLGGWLEAVDVTALDLTLYVNESGLVHRLPFNARASFLWWFHTGGRSSAMLVGDVVIVGSPDEHGADTDLTDETVQLLSVPDVYRILVDASPAHGDHVDVLKLTHGIVPPLAQGDTNRYVGAGRYSTYFDALAWAYVVRERWQDAVGISIVPERELAL